MLKTLQRSGLPLSKLLGEFEVFKSSFGEINKLLLDYAGGNYHKRGKISNKLHSVDSVINGINMLGEELESSTISRNYFTSIFNAIPDMILVVSPRGTIKSMNEAAQRNLQFEYPNLKLSEFLKEERNIFGRMKRTLEQDASYANETVLTSSSGKKIPVWCLCSKIVGVKNEMSGYLFVARDITDKKENERLLLRAIVEAQEKEQQRVAADLHDSFGQELTALKLFINSLDPKVLEKEPYLKQLLSQCNSILDGSIQNLRNICFNLLPGSLELSGLADSIEVLINSFGPQHAIHFSYLKPKKADRLEKDLELTLYRITQEFINNSIKHAQASEVLVELKFGKNVTLNLRDNGIGFKFEKNKFTTGNGLKNMQSRVKAFNGEFKLNTRPSKGMQVLIKIPVHVG